jgi:hypothetical protein
MSLKNKKPSLLRQASGGALSILMIAAGLAATASYGYAETKDSDKEKVVEKDVRVVVDTKRDKRVLVFNGTEDEIVFDDMVVGDRVQVMEFDDGDGERRVVRIKNGEKTVRVFDKDGSLISENVTNVGDGDHVFVWNDGQHSTDIDVIVDDISFTTASCSAEDGEGEPVMLEFKDESGDENNKEVSHTVICLTGVDAEPENRVEALRAAIDRIEEQAKQDEQRRKDMIKSLRKQARELEKQN